ncbi:SRPBCC domain-containing protein [uncultured Paludibaculum sp.]|uniref:SRPBCC family protein n=1 Tax=uncultured Paludibaculum sp. TaxID=1765020 RepID=UPI002AAAEAFC|nr:SRPBCC domain-containing protein [uncultured Paludibaculum sp.]
MSVKKDPSGRRYVQAEVEVPGTVEEVWAAIATGPGVSSWFVPVEGGGEIGATVTAHFGPGMDSVATVTAWEPLHRFAAESADLGPNAPSIATEWTVEAKAGGTCIVRVVHSLFASTDDWDNQLNGIESGWPAFFRILHLYLAHYRGQQGTMFRAMGMTKDPEPEAWSKLAVALGLEGAQPGDRRASSPEAPPLAGILEEPAGGGHPHQVLMRLESPGPGIAHLFSMPMGEMVILSLSVYLYGGDAPSAASANEPLWHKWLAGLYAPPDGSAQC